MTHARIAFLCAPVIVAAVACGGRDYWPGPVAPTRSSAAIAQPMPEDDTFRRLPGPHPRILLTNERLASLAALRDSGHEAWKALIAKCDEASSKAIESGYQAWDWANASLSLALCAKATQKSEYAAAAIRYVNALLDDKAAVGDKLGGEKVVEDDEGYPIRTHGAMAAIALDWLWDAPGMTDAIKKHAADRLVQWVTWFKDKGYGHDAPIGNYYVGYFATVAFGGIALESHDARAAALRQQTETMWTREIVPTYKRKLAGGDWPEGWQYGSLSCALLAMYAEAERNAHPHPLVARADAGAETGADKSARSLAADLPWLTETVSYHAHALLPDGKHVHEAGDWQEKPPRATWQELLAIAATFSPSDRAGKQARALARLVRDPARDESPWLTALAEGPSRPAEDPRGGALSYLSRGTGQVFARTSWTPNAVFASLASAPSLSDHQHLDAGHFAIVRGADHLVIDAGAYGSFSSMSHNTILVDAEPALSTYAPNQGTWSDSASIARFEEHGEAGAPFTYALADYASAYNPSTYPKESADRAVTRAEREWIFSRTPVAAMPGGESARVVIYDRITVAKPEIATTFIVHPGDKHDEWGSLARFETGGSALWMASVLPGRVTLQVVSEPTPKKDDKPYFENSPPEGRKTVRLAIKSGADASSNERRFLTVFAVGTASARGDAKVPIGEGSPSIVRIEGDVADGVALENEAYVFAAAGPQPAPMPIAYNAPPQAVRHIVVGLAPSGKYAVRAARAGAKCRVTLAPGEGKTASAQGVMVLGVADCGLK